jgi:hypothetical protein
VLRVESRSIIEQNSSRVNELQSGAMAKVRGAKCEGARVQVRGATCEWKPASRQRRR